MSRPKDPAQSPRIRPIYPRDLEYLTTWEQDDLVVVDALNPSRNVLPQTLRPWSMWLKQLGNWAMPNGQRWSGFVVESDDQPCGLIEVSPFNRTRSTWRVDRVIINPTALSNGLNSPLDKVGSQLLRHCFETIWEARMWLAEVAVSQTSALALYRQNGFQPLAQVTYWDILPEGLTQLAQQEPDLPNVVTVSNADAQLLYQLDTAAMPPLVRQVFDQQIQDFKVEPLQGMTTQLLRRVQGIDVLCGYVFEPQRKAAIGRFEVTASRDSRRQHQAELTVHPAYTWLYPELLSHMARLLEGYPAMPLRMTSRDYQPEREDYLTKIQAEPVERTLMLSRSVWHKVRETKPTALEGLQLQEVLSGLQPAGKPIPGRMSWYNPISQGSVWPSEASSKSLHRPDSGQPDQGIQDS
ncbi:MAG: GNAT family N-acetyltransferase [Cyanobacteria bacterium]|nr:GNAT family N-acetyltransferase [Cyanobacteriota bacterium]MDA0865885.1 GNAT family N-acetyltransferase [Cyanobacteriota bacterium]